YFFRSSSDQAAAGFPVFMIGVIAGAVIFTWLFNNTRGSVLLVMLFHTFINMWIEVFPAPAADQAVAQWCFNALLLILAIVVLVTLLFGRGRRVARKRWAVAATATALLAGIVGVSGAGLAIATMGGLPPYDSRVALGWTALALAAAATFLGLSSPVRAVVSGLGMALA